MSISTSSSSTVSEFSLNDQEFLKSFIKENEDHQNILSILFAKMLETPSNQEEQERTRCFFKCLAMHNTDANEHKYALGDNFGSILSTGLSPNWVQLTQGTILENLSPIAELARKIDEQHKELNVEQKFFKLYQTLQLKGYRYSGILPTTLQNLAEMQKQYQMDCDEALYNICNVDPTPNIELTPRGIRNCTPDTCGFTAQDTLSERANKVREWLHNNPRHVQGTTELNLSFLKLKVLPPEIVQYFSHVTRLQLYANELQGIDLQNFPNLSFICLEANGLQRIILNNLPLLSTLLLCDNQLQTINLGCLPRLDQVALMRNQLKEVVLGHLPLLATLDLSENQIQKINLNDLPNLSHLGLANNPIQSVDLPNQREWRYLTLPTKLQMELLAQCAARLEFPEISVIEALLNSIDPPIENKLDKKIWKLAGSPMDGNPYWGREHRYDDAERFYRALPIDDATKDSFHAYDADVKNRVYGKVWELAGGPEGDPQWGEHHIFDDAYLFYSALGHVLDSGSST